MTRHQDRLEHLDGLRGVAALCVILFHSYLLVPSLGARVLPGGFLGVDVFFVLSGFLMTTILLEQGSNPQFYARRAARILPALYLLLVSQVLYTWLLGDRVGPDLRAAIPMALGVGNWNQTAHIGVPLSLAQTWSLGIEMQFYLIWPVVLMIFARRRGQLHRVVVAGIVGSCLIRLVLAHAGVPLGAIFSQTECRFDALLVGALVALVWRAGWRPAFLPQMAVVAGVFLLWALEFARSDAMWLFDGGFTLVALASGVIIFACVHATRGTGIVASRALRSCGRFSYSGYLWHPFVFIACTRALPGIMALRVSLGVLSLVAIAVSSTVCVEEPLRRRIAARLRRPAAPRPSPGPPRPALLSEVRAGAVPVGPSAPGRAGLRSP